MGCAYHGIGVPSPATRKASERAPRAKRTRPQRDNNMPKPIIEARNRRRLARTLAVEDVVNALNTLAAKNLDAIPLDAQPAYRDQITHIHDMISTLRAYPHIGRAPRAWIADAQPVDGVTTDQPKE